MVRLSGPFLLYLTSFTVLDLAGADRRHEYRHLLAAWNALSDSENPHRSCHSCGTQGTNRRMPTMASAELTALRIELIKAQILKKLRLKEPPVVSLPLSALPKPLANGSLLHKATESRTAKNYDDFYGTTDQVIIFPQKEGVRCTPAAINPAACFTFKLPADLEADDVTTAVLWIYKLRDNGDSRNQTFVVSDVAHWDLNQSVQKTKPLVIHETDVKAGWVKINLIYTLTNWLEYQELTHAIHISCKTCVRDVGNSPLSLEPEQKPFIVITTNTARKNRRPKRNLSCHAGMNECCRENLYISFADIGWDDWILQPSGYHAYFCRGSCTLASSITNSGTHYSSVLRRLTFSSNSRARRLELVPCCTPTSLSSLQLLYVDNNQTVTQKTLPNMVVDSCGCM